MGTASTMAQLKRWVDGAEYACAPAVSADRKRIGEN